MDNGMRPSTIDYSVGTLGGKERKQKTENPEITRTYGSITFFRTLRFDTHDYII